jgi:hypothetical protein
MPDVSSERAGLMVTKVFFVNRNLRKALTERSKQIRNSNVPKALTTDS